MLTDHPAILSESKWSCLLYWIVLQDALREVTKIYPHLKIEGIRGRHHSTLDGKFKEVAEMGEKVMKRLREEVEKKGLKLSITENGKVKRLGVKETARRKKCKVRFSLIKKKKAFQKSYMKVGVKKFLRTGRVPARAGKRTQWEWPLKKGLG